MIKIQSKTIDLRSKLLRKHDRVCGVYSPEASCWGLLFQAELLGYHIILSDNWNYRSMRICCSQIDHSSIMKLLYLYNNPSYSRILIGSRLWSIRGQTHDWRHHYRVFPSAVLKWWKVLRIRIIFYVAGQKGSRSQKTKDKAVSFRKWYKNNFLAASVGSRARLNHAQTWSW